MENNRRNKSYNIGYDDVIVSGLVCTEEKGGQHNDITYKRHEQNDIRLFILASSIAKNDSVNYADEFCRVVKRRFSCLTSEDFVVADELDPAAYSKKSLSKASKAIVAGIDDSDIAYSIIMADELGVCVTSNSKDEVRCYVTSDGFLQQLSGDRTDSGLTQGTYDYSDYNSMFLMNRGAYKPLGRDFMEHLMYTTEPNKTVETLIQRAQEKAQDKTPNPGAIGFVKQSVMTKAL